MIDFPSLPTDSLYKFLALAGVLLCAMSLYTYVRFYTLIKSKVFNVKSDIQEREAEIAFLESQESPEQSEILKVRVKHNRTKVQVEELEWYSKQLIVIGLLSFLFASSGAFMTYKGFNLWYWKIQVHQDKLIELKVDELEKGL
ncbi:TPA: hypothetical protein NKA09_003195 [Vibrio parahaemolyticus]|nr:hypothetical protein [Vibrio vulnificus]HCE2173237.1 hypothetical protein [Vibrio parahaemolyticus]HCG7994590.1 hypothetical protein [Vibrio parahaemolyticus]